MSDAAHEFTNDQAEERNPVEVLGEDFLARRRLGEHVTAQQYMDSHPELAEEIGLQFPVMAALERFKSCAFSSSDDDVELKFEAVQQLGDFRIIREIGRGAMGVVYEAEQQSLRRRVAVKVFPRQTLQESRQLERFRREAQTAASLHHTNIVPVFGVGEHDGLHYFVMQRIDGIGLDQVQRTAKQRANVDDETCAKPIAFGSTYESGSAAHESAIEPFGVAPLQSAASSLSDLPANEHSGVADSTKLPSSFRSLASVGIQVAQALDYAHSQGVLHRDIKPSNLILDPRGTVWVADFGLATVMHPDQEVGAGEVAGTLRFMAPEQLGGEFDARSDIYSLGATLYDLLTEQPAFEADSRAQLIDRILKGDFTAPRKIRPGIPRDFEAIVLKAMARDPADRYQAAAEMATDLQRFNDGRPVHARPIGVVDRTIRWTQRNPIIASLCASLLLVAFGSLFLISAKWREAVAERQRAEGNLSLALDSMDQILDRFTSNWMTYPTDSKSIPGVVATPGNRFQMVASDQSAELMQAALKFYDRFAAENAANPRLQRDTAKVYRRVADIYQRLGQYQQAEDSYRRCLLILNQQMDGDDTALMLEEAETLNQLGLTLHASSHFDEAEQEFLRARTLLGDQACQDDPDCQAELARTNNNLGQAQWLMLRNGEARQSHGEAVAILEGLVKGQPDNVDYQLSLARAYRTYYPLTSNRRGESERILSAGIAILETLVRDYPNVPDYRCELSETLAAPSYGARRPQNTSQRIEQIQRSIEVARKLTLSHPLIPRYRIVLARALNEMAQLTRRSQPEESLTQLSESISIYRSLSHDFSDIPAYHILLAMALRSHAENLRRMNRLDESRISAEEGVKEQEAYMALRPNNRFGAMMLSGLYDELARTLSQLNETAEADKARSEAQRLRQRWDDRSESNSQTN